MVCASCRQQLEATAVFLESVTTATRLLVGAARGAATASASLMLDEETHVRQYLRAYNSPQVPHIKVEPGALCDVDLQEQASGGGYLGQHHLVHCAKPCVLFRSLG